MPLSLEEEARRRELLWSRIISLSCQPVSTALEEPGLTPVQAGQAARLGEDLLCTASLLLEGAEEVLLRGPDGSEVSARPRDRDLNTLTATLPCTGPCRHWPTLPLAPDSSRQAGRGLFVVLPALPDQPVLSPTVSLGPEASPFPELFAVAGRLAPGTLLHDSSGALVGLVVRGHPQRADRSLAAPGEACMPKAAVMAPSDPAPGGTPP